MFTALLLVLLLLLESGPVPGGRGRLLRHLLYHLLLKSPKCELMERGAFHRKHYSFSFREDRPSQRCLCPTWTACIKCWDVGKRSCRRLDLCDHHLWKLQSLVGVMVQRPHQESHIICQGHLLDRMSITAFEKAGRLPVHLKQEQQLALAGSERERADGADPDLVLQCVAVVRWCLLSLKREAGSSSS